MNYDVVFYWKDLPERDLRRSVVVVADILRATTVMVRALYNGAAAILPQDREEIAQSAYALLRERGIPALLCGEKEGFKRPGYDLGNSPREFTPGTVKDRTIVHLTTNGTRAMVGAQGAREILIAAFSNLSAVTAYLRDLDEDVENVLLVVSGREGQYCLEDTVCLGGILNGLINPPGQSLDLTDAGLTAMNLFQVHSGSLLEMLRQSHHGWYLEQIGLGEDLPECALVDTYNVVPVLKDGKVTLSA